MTEIDNASAAPRFRTSFVADEGFERRATRAIFPLTLRSPRVWAATLLIVTGSALIGLGTSSPAYALVYGLAVFLLMLGLFWWTIRGALRRHVAKVGREVAYAFGDERIVVEQGGKAGSSTAYELYERWTPVSDGYVLRNVNRVYVFLPGEAVSPELAAFLDEKINRRGASR